MNGYDIEREQSLHPGYLAELPTAAMLTAGPVTYRETAIDPRDTIKIENQGGIGACQGHALSSIVEWCYMLQLNDIDGVQLSRAAAYYETQRLDRIRGDRGSTISGGVKLSRTWGVPEEALWPYRARYDNDRPSNWDAVTESAHRYKIANAVKVTDYEQARVFLGSGVGGISLGIRWSRNYGAVIDRAHKGKGGHAVALISLADRKDKDDNPYLWLVNSWGTRWGNRGWAEVSPAAVRAWLRDSFTTAVGLTELPNVQPRDFDRKTWAERLSVI